MIIGEDVIVAKANDHAKPLPAETIPTAKTASRPQFFLSTKRKSFYPAIRGSPL
jgi:hypothetical protein